MTGRISVLVATYEQPEWLTKVLWGLSVQTDSDFEVIVADDGSSAPTAAAIQRSMPAFAGRLVHLRQERNGFGKCAIVNQAILAARGDYLVLLDGDCVPRGDFVATHRRLARPGHFLSGGAFRLPMATSQQLTAEDITAGRAFLPAWLHRHGVSRSLRLARLGATGGWARLLDAITPTRPTFNGGNSSLWRRDAIAINGFDERLVYGGEDREFGERLSRSGVAGRQVRHRAIVLHLDHPRGYRSDSGERRNLEIRKEGVKEGTTRARQGLERYVSAGDSAPG